MQFPVGVEYYRAAMPPQSMWEHDFAAIRESGFRVIRTFSSWNWMEPAPGKYELDDFDRFFELAEKNDLKVDFDLTLSTHMACPDWLIRRYPDILVVFNTGEVSQPFASSAATQGGNRHCYDHPAWKEHGSALMRHVVGRYKDSPALGMWSVWDGPQLPGQGNDVSRPGETCYCHNTLAKYQTWLQSNFTLDELNERLDRRYRSWEDVEAPRSHELVMAMLLFRQFLYENLVDTFQWQFAQVRAIDDKHELHSHGFRYHGPFDEMLAPHCDSWGFAAHTTNLLASDDPYAYANVAYASQWSWAIGKDHQWWYDEIYSGMYHSDMAYRKQSTPADLALNLWFSVAYGAKGAMFWQYRPEYASHEAPGLNLVSAAGLRLPRLEAVEETIRGIAAVEPYLPLTVPKAQVALVYDAATDDLANMADAREDYWSAVRGVHRGLWEKNIPVDLITPNMDWAGYKVIYMPHQMVLTAAAIEKITTVIREQPDTHLIADGLLGLNSNTGRFSYEPPEGLARLLDVDALDYSQIDDRDIRNGTNVIKTDQGNFAVTQAVNYASVVPGKTAKTFACYGDEVVGVQSCAGRFTWITIPLSNAFGGLPPAAMSATDLPYGHNVHGIPPDALLMPLLERAGVQPPVAVSGSRTVTLVREAADGGVLVFVINLEDETAAVTIKLRQAIADAVDVIAGKTLAVDDHSFAIDVPAHSVRVVHARTLADGT